MCSSEYELAARSTLTQTAFDYIAVGAGDGISLEESRAAWRRYRLRRASCAEGRHPMFDGDTRNETGDAARGRADRRYQVVAHTEGEVETPGA